MSAHTPGPWVFGNWADKKQGEPDGASWVEIWSLQDGEDALPFVACKHQDQLANARLIAAAPELLEALKDMLEVHGVRWEHVRADSSIPQSWVELSDKARAAIAKATPEAKP